MLLGFSIKDLIDILLVALMLFYLYKFMKESGSLNLFIGILVIVVTWVMVSQIFQMRIWNICETITHVTTMTRMPMKRLSEPDSFMNLYRQKSMSATNRMSIKSFMLKPSNIYFLYSLIFLSFFCYLYSYTNNRKNSRILNYRENICYSVLA